MQILIQNIKKKKITRKGRKEMFYLTMHSTHFIYGYMASDILFTNALSTFLLIDILEKDF